jgi:hypothetical protein
MQPKPIRVIPQVENVPQQGTLADPSATPAPVKKAPVSYEDSLKKMTNKQLRHEVRKGMKGELTGYRAVAESVVLDVILDSLEQGMSPFVR